MRFVRLSRRLLRQSLPTTSAVPKMVRPVGAAAAASQQECPTSRTEPCLTSSTGSGPSAHEPLEAVLARFYTALSQTNGGAASPHSFPQLHSLAVSAMKQCLTQRRPTDAADIYQALNSSGLLSLGASAGLAPELDQLALHAYSDIPHQTQSSQAVRRLLAAESEAGGRGGGEEDGVVLRARPSTAMSPLTPPLAPSGRMDRRWSRSSAPSLTTDTAPVSAAEAFRVTLHQRVQLLRAVGQLSLPLGRNYFLTEVRNVLDSPELRAEAEAEPLALLSAALLHHPFTHAQPSAEWAQRLCFFGELDGLPASAGARGLSVAQREALVALEEGVSSLRLLCHPSLRLLTSVAADWDEVLHRRLAQCLLLPHAAHDVFPESYREQRRRHRSARRLLADLGVEAAEKASLAKWTDPRHDLFHSPSADSTGSPVCWPQGSTDVHAAVQVALARAEHIVRRRSRRGVVVPDAAYVLCHLRELQQLARHREVVLTHGVLLELVRLALQRGGPIPFHARRALRTLMLRTTTALTADAKPSGPMLVLRNPQAIPSRRPEEAGVTVLGLQDELALLEGCSDRFDTEQAGGDSGIREGAEGESDGDAGYMERLTADRTVRPTRHSTVLVAQQLRHMLACHARGTSLGQARQQRQPVRGSDPLLSATQTSLVENMEDLVDGIVGANAAAADVADECAATQRSGGARPQGTPLFKSRSRTYWASVPVVVATTDDSTRVAAYMLGLQTYPPTTSS